MKKLMAILICFAVMVFVSKVALADDKDDIAKRHQERMKKIHAARIATPSPVTIARPMTPDARQAYAVYLAKAALGYKPGLDGVDYSVINIAKNDAGGWDIVIARAGVYPGAVATL